MEKVPLQGDVRINHVVTLSLRALTEITNSQESATGQDASNTFIVTKEHTDSDQLASSDTDNNVDDASSDSDHGPQTASDAGVSE